MSKWLILIFGVLNLSGQLLFNPFLQIPAMSESLPVLADYTKAADPRPDDPYYVVEDPDIAVVTMSPSGKSLAAGDLHGMLKVWEVESCTLQKVIKIITPSEPENGNPWYVTAAAYSLDGQWLATGGRDQAIRIWNISLIPSTRESVEFVAHDGHVRALSYDPTGRFLASSGHDGKVKIWDSAHNFEKVGVLPVSDGYVFSFAFSPDGKKIVSNGSEGSVALWDLGSKSLVKQFSIKGGRARGVAYSPNGELIAVAVEGTLEGWKEESPTVRVWSPSSEKEIFSFRAHKEAAIAVAFSKGGEYLASGGNDGVVNIWSMETGELVNKLVVEERKVVEEYGGEAYEVTLGAGTIQSLQFSLDGQYLIAGGYGYLPRLWDWKNEQILKEFREEGCGPQIKNK